jgi:hypothetical protein
MRIGKGKLIKGEIWTARKERRNARGKTEGRRNGAMEDKERDR